MGRICSASFFKTQISIAHTVRSTFAYTPCIVQEQMLDKWPPFNAELLRTAQGMDHGFQECTGQLRITQDAESEIKYYSKYVFDEEIMLTYKLKKADAFFIQKDKGSNSWY